MKAFTLPFLAVASLFTLGASAQTDTAVRLNFPTQKGGWTIGSSLVVGELAFGSTDSRYRIAGSYNVSLNPKAGYFIKDNLLIGGTLRANVVGNSFGSKDFSNYHSRSIGAGIFARQYFGKGTMKDGSLRKMRYFLEGGVDVSKGWSNWRSSDSTTERTNFSIASIHVMPGFNYFFSKNVALEGGINISHMATSKNVIGNANHIGINLGLQIFLGKR